MNLYKRPLFMQQGGMARVPVPTPPAAMRPAAAPQGAMPPMRPATAPMGPMGLPRAPAAAPAARPTDQAAGIASMVSDKAKADLAQAQGPEQIINAFRGNQKPLEARYEELAQYVGPQDATATPISVLTMVQPSLMMTAKGASESGIGELMAGIAGRVPMESAPGAPNRMGQGLGNIMMSRQAPQPAGMAQGGVVGKFAEGGSSLKDYYDEDLATFQEIMAPTQADRDASKRQLFFDIAQRGLAMAGGAGGSGNVASQLANVFQTLPGTYAAQQAELRKGEQGARNAALQSAAGRVNADRASAARRGEMEYESELAEKVANQQFVYDMTAEERQRQTDIAAAELLAQAEREDRNSDIFQYVSPKGELLSRPFDLSDPDSRAEALALGEIVNGALMQVKDVDSFAPALSSTRGTTKPVRLIMPNGDFRTFDENNPNDAAGLLAAIKDGGKRVDLDVAEEALGSPTDAALSTQMSVLAEGTRLSPASEANLINALQTYDTDRIVMGTDSVGRPTTITIKGTAIPDNYIKTIQEAIAAGIFPADGLPLKYRTQPVVSALPAPVPGPVVPGQALNDMLATETAPVQQAPVQQAPVQTVVPSRTDLLGVEVDASILEAAGMPEQDFLQADFTDVVGTQERVKQVAGSAAVPVIRLFEGLIPGAGTLAEAIEKSDQESGLTASLNNLNTGLMTKFQETRTGKAAGDEREEFRALIPPPYSFFQQPKQFINDYKALYRTFAQQYRDDINLLNSPSALSDTDRTDLIRSINANKTAIDDLEGVIQGAERSFSQYSDEIRQSPQETTGSIERARAAALGTL